MDDERFHTLYRLVAEFSPPRGKRQQYSDGFILLVFLWSALRRKPRFWACHPRNAPACLCQFPLPSPSRFSRRLRSPAFELFWKSFMAHLINRQNQATCLLACFLIDAKALPVNPHSKDQEARRGWATDSLAKGYKLFLLIDTAGRIVAWRIHPMNAAEQTVALDLFQDTDKPGYVLADAVYDTNDCYQAARARDLQLIAPRKDPSANIGPRASCPARLHAIAMLETPCASAFGFGLYDQRTGIEQVFSRMASSQVGLDSLPGWVRTLRRVRLWIEAMIAFCLVFPTAH